MLWWGRLDNRNRVVPSSGLDIPVISASSSSSEGNLPLLASAISNSNNDAHQNVSVGATSTLPKNISATEIVFNPSSPLQTQKSASSSAIAPAEESVPVVFVIALPQETRTVNFSARAGDTVYDAMKALARDTNFDIQFKEFTGLGAMVQAINGVANDARANKFWIYYINGALAKSGISSIKINSHDIITWHYEAGKD